MTEAATETRQPKGLSRFIGHLPALLGVLLLVGAIYVVQKEFRHLKLADISQALKAIPRSALIFSFVWTILSYFILTFYDRLGTIYAGKVVAYHRVAFASFCAYALAHNLGFAAVSGAAVRYRLYAHWGLTPFQIGKTVAFCSLTFALGGLVLGGTILMTEPTTVPFFGHYLPELVLRGIGLLLWLIVLGYVTMSTIVGSFKLRGHEIDLPNWRMAIVQVALATVDVAVTATIFFALLPHAPGLTWQIFLGVYVASYTAGLAANLPGGIGVFDTAMLFGLEPYLEAPLIVGAIVVFRLYYYIIPLFLAGGLFAGNELILRGGVVARVLGLKREDGRPSQPWSEPDFAVATATGLVVLCGAMLVMLGVIAPPTDYSWLDPDLADFAVQAGQFIPSLIGSGLIILALGLSHRVNLAWGLTLLLLLAGGAITLNTIIGDGGTNGTASFNTVGNSASGLAGAYNGTVTISGDGVTMGMNNIVQNTATGAGDRSFDVTLTGTSGGVVYNALTGGAGTVSQSSSVTIDSASTVRYAVQSAATGTSSVTATLNNVSGGVYVQQDSGASNAAVNLTVNGGGYTLGTLGALPTGMTTTGLPGNFFGTGGANPGVAVYQNSATPITVTVAPTSTGYTAAITHSP